MNSGTIEEVKKGNRQGIIFLIQDAHSIPDAQKNIQKTIQEIKSEYPVSLVGLEGGAGKLDTTFLKAYPDHENLEKVLNSFLEKGELAGGAAAAVFDQTKTDYAGLENDQLYQEGLRLYGAASQDKENRLAELEIQENRLQEEKRKIYPESLLRVEEKISDFHQSKISFDALLKNLFTIIPPNKNSLLGKLRIFVVQGSNNKMELGLKELGSKLFEKIPEEKKPDFNQKKQAFEISQLAAEEYASYLLKIAEELEMADAVPDLIRESAQLHQTFLQLKGSHLLEELEGHVERATNYFLKTDDQKRLNNQWKQLQITKKAVRLELTPKEWEKVSQLNHPTLNRQIQFYKNSEKRDEAIFQNLVKSLNSYQTKNAILVAGGFHTERLLEKIKKEGFSYALIQPKIETIPAENYYLEHMKGNVSWKEYLKIDHDGKANLYAAFLRAVRDQLIKDSEKELLSKSYLLKNWRDRILCQIAIEERLEEVQEYTRFIDETASLPQSLLAQKADRFSKGLLALEKNKQWSVENISRLIQSFKIPGSLDSVSVFIPGSEVQINNAAIDFRESNRSELRQDDTLAEFLKSAPRAVSEDPNLGRILSAEELNKNTAFTDEVKRLLAEKIVALKKNTSATNSEFWLGRIKTGNPLFLAGSDGHLLGVIDYDDENNKAHLSDLYFDSDLQKGRGQRRYLTTAFLREIYLKYGEEDFLLFDDVDDSDGVLKRLFEGNHVPYEHPNELKTSPVKIKHLARMFLFQQGAPQRSGFALVKILKTALNGNSDFSHLKFEVRSAFPDEIYINIFASAPAMDKQLKDLADAAKLRLIEIPHNAIATVKVSLINFQEDGEPFLYIESLQPSYSFRKLNQKGSSFKRTYGNWQDLIVKEIIQVAQKMHSPVVFGKTASVAELQNVEMGHGKANRYYHTPFKKSFRKGKKRFKNFFFSWKEVEDVIKNETDAYGKPRFFAGGADELWRHDVNAWVNETPNLDPELQQQLSRKQFQRVYDAIRSKIVRTPLIPLLTLSEQTGKQVFIKDESFQNGGAFKGRGVYWEVFVAIEKAIDDHLKGIKSNGRDKTDLEYESGLKIVTQSTGNHGIAMIRAVTQAVEFFSDKYKDNPDLVKLIQNIQPVVFTLKNLPEVKLQGMNNALKEYQDKFGREILVGEEYFAKGSIFNSFRDYETALLNRDVYIVGQRGAGRYMEHGGIDIMRGHGSAGIEIAEQLKEAGIPEDEKVVLLLPVGAGGPLGIGAALKQFRENIRVVMVQSDCWDAFVRTLQTGEPQKNDGQSPPTIFHTDADGERKGFIFPDGIAVDGPEGDLAVATARQFLDAAVAASEWDALGEGGPLLLKDLADGLKQARSEEVRGHEPVIGGTTALTAQALLDFYETLGVIREAEVVVLFGAEGNVDEFIQNELRKEAGLSPLSRSEARIRIDHGRTVRPVVDKEVFGANSSGGADSHDSRSEMSTLTLKEAKELFGDFEGIDPFHGMVSELGSLEDEVVGSTGGANAVNFVPFRLSATGKNVLGQISQNQPKATILDKFFVLAEKELNPAKHFLPFAMVFFYKDEKGTKKPILIDLSKFLSTEKTSADVLKGLQTYLDAEDSKVNKENVLIQEIDKDGGLFSKQYRGGADRSDSETLRREAKPAQTNTESDNQPLTAQDVKELFGPFVNRETFASFLNDLGIVKRETLSSLQKDQMTSYELDLSEQGIDFVEDLIQVIFPKKPQPTSAFILMNTRQHGEDKYQIPFGIVFFVQDNGEDIPVFFDLTEYFIPADIPQDELKKLHSESLTKVQTIVQTIVGGRGFPVFRLKRLVRGTTKWFGYEESDPTERTKPFLTTFTIVMPAEQNQVYQNAIGENREEIFISPDSAGSTDWQDALMLKYQANKRFFEVPIGIIGTGSGIDALLAASLGCKKIDAVDIHTIYVLLSRLNFGFAQETKQIPSDVTFSAEKSNGLPTGKKFLFNAPEIVPPVLEDAFRGALGNPPPQVTSFAILEGTFRGIIGRIERQLKEGVVEEALLRISKPRLDANRKIITDPEIEEKDARSVLTPFPDLNAEGPHHRFFYTLTAKQHGKPSAHDQRIAPQESEVRFNFESTFGKLKALSVLKEIVASLGELDGTYEALKNGDRNYRLNLKKEGKEFLLDMLKLHIFIHYQSEGVTPDWNELLKLIPDSAFILTQGNSGLNIPYGILFSIKDETSRMAETTFFDLTELFIPENLAPGGVIQEHEKAHRLASAASMKLFDGREIDERFVLQRITEINGDWLKWSDPKMPVTQRNLEKNLTLLSIAQILEDGREQPILITPEMSGSHDWQILIDAAIAGLGKNVLQQLEVGVRGSGIGVDSMKLLKGGARKVVATDIFRIYVELSKWNAAFLKATSQIDPGAVFQIELTPDIPKGGIVFFNAPAASEEGAAAKKAIQLAGVPFVQSFNIPIDELRKIVEESIGEAKKGRQMVLRIHVLPKNKAAHGINAEDCLEAIERFIRPYIQQNPDLAFVQKQLNGGILLPYFVIEKKSNRSEIRSDAGMNSLESDDLPSNQRSELRRTVKDLLSILQGSRMSYIDVQPIFAAGARETANMMRSELRLAETEPVKRATAHFKRIQGLNQLAILKDEFIFKAMASEPALAKELLEEIRKIILGKSNLIFSFKIQNEASIRTVLKQMNWDQSVRYALQDSELFLYHEDQKDYWGMGKATVVISNDLMKGDLKILRSKIGTDFVDLTGERAVRNAVNCFVGAVLLSAVSTDEALQRGLQKMDENSFQFENESAFASMNYLAMFIAQNLAARQLSAAA